MTCLFVLSRIFVCAVIAMRMQSLCPSSTSVRSLCATAIASTCSVMGFAPAMTFGDNSTVINLKRATRKDDYMAHDCYNQRWIGRKRENMVCSCTLEAIAI